MPEDKNNAPAPEALHTKADAAKTEVEQVATPSERDTKKLEKQKKRRGTYRPSHKATFIGLIVIAIILIVNGGIIFFVVKGNSKKATQRQDTVTLSTDTLDKLGISRNPVDLKGTELTVGPDAKFQGKVTVGGDMAVTGRLILNNKLQTSSASIATLQAGKVSLQQLDVNGDATMSTLNLRKDLNVAGATRLQGTVTITNLVTINNSMNVAGNLAVGGTFTANNFQANSLTSGSTLTIGGHIITRGSAPYVSGGGALGSNGTVSISGSDAAGTVAANIGAGASSGTLANISFRSGYSNTPHVVITPIGRGGTFYINRSASGFSIGTSSALPPGGYAFDYIVMQ